MTTTFALFFLMIGVIIMTTVAIDPTGAAFEVAPERDLLPTLSLGSGFLAFGAALMAITLKQSGRGAIRWVCQRCGALFRKDPNPGKD
ncbi:MAG: hypothetical protein ACKVVP_22820 [Chloroflexota bacterium]